MDTKPEEKNLSINAENLAACQIESERYRVFIEDVADGFYETNLKGDFIFFNQAFCRIFGRPPADMQNRHFRDFMDEKNARIAYENFNKVYRTGKGFTDINWEITRRDGKKRILEISAKLIFDKGDEKVGFRGIARDVTEEKRAARSNQALFRIAKALPYYGQVDRLLEFIIEEVQILLDVEGASVILVDEEKKEFYFPAATFDDAAAEEKIKEVRFPLDKGVAGQVYKTRQPMIVPDTAESPFFFKQVDDQTHYQTRNMLDVPIQLQDRMIGVLCAVNKKDREFDQADVFLLSTIAGTVALPIENARINEALKRSYEEVQSLNRAKDRVIHHLSHELKTPVSVLAASLSQLDKTSAGAQDGNRQRILNRMQRNLNRLLEMQYEIEDILKERSYRSYYMLSTLLDSCTDELEALVSENLCEVDIVDRIRKRVEALFGPREAISEEIRLDGFVEAFVEKLRPRFVHRSCTLSTRISPVAPIWIPREVLVKILEGLLRNAIENTPDKGKVEVTVNTGLEGPELAVQDYGIGITKDNQRLIFESNFTATETMNYSSRNRFDFNAGGRGFDLLRMKIFSERYRFKLQMVSERCRYIPQDSDLCPGDIEKCRHCRSTEDCFGSGGTTMTVKFFPADLIKPETDLN